MTNTTTPDVLLKNGVISYTLWYFSEKLEYYSPREVDLPISFFCSEPVRPVGVKIAFLADAELILEARHRVRHTFGNQVLGRILSVLDKLDFIELGTDMSYRRKQIELLRMLYTSLECGMPSIFEPRHGWQEWLVNLASSGDLSSLTKQELNDLGWALTVASSSFAHVLDNEASDDHSSLINFTLHSIQKGVYPWKFESD
jgi:hypothetical protein